MRKMTAMVFFLVFGLFLCGCGSSEPGTSLDRAEKERGEVLETDEKDPVAVCPSVILCDGAGSLRLAVYLGCADRVSGVEQIEKDDSQTVPYRIACPHLRRLPVTGESHGRQNIEAILTLEKRPELILRSKNTGAGMDPKVLESRTGIPVKEFLYGDLGEERETLYASLRLLGRELGVSPRAEAVIAFIEENVRELQRRCPKLLPHQRPRVYLGGLSYRGAHGFHSTSSDYPPFVWVGAQNVVRDGVQELIPAEQMAVSREQILLWDPQVVFLDLGTMNVPGKNGIQELQTDPLYRQLDAVKNGRVFALYPNSSYQANLEARLANAWFIGKTLYPEAFTDVDLEAKVREIFEFLTGASVMDEVAEPLRSQVFRPVLMECISQEGVQEGVQEVSP